MKMHSVLRLDASWVGVRFVVEFRLVGGER